MVDHWLALAWKPRHHLLWSLALAALVTTTGQHAQLLLWEEPLERSDALAMPMAEMLEARLPCNQIHEAMLQTVSARAQRAARATDLFMEQLPALLERLQQEDTGEGAPSPYAVLFGDCARAVQLGLDTVQWLSFVAMSQKRCFSSSARLALGQALLPLQKALGQQVSTMWWMFDIGQYSNTNNPTKHLQAIHTALRQIEAIFEHLLSTLPEALVRMEHFWGHGEHGMFMNSTVIYRNLFPESALVDKGLLRTLLRVLNPGSSLADFGALDGQYSGWLNDTGWVTAFAFDGVEGVSELTGGRVSQVDLAEDLHIPWHPGPFDWVLCLEVAEHIPPEREEAFLSNLARHAERGIVLSWAPPEVEGEGHVNCLPLEESRQRIESLGFKQDVEATAALRAASQIPWIQASVALYRRLE